MSGQSVLVQVMACFMLTYDQRGHVAFDWAILQEIELISIIKLPHISPKGQWVNIAMEMSYKQWPGLVCLFWCAANLPTRTFTRNQQPYPSYWHRSVWWRHQMEISSALLALCAGNSPVTVEFPAQMPVTRNFDVFFDLRLNKLLSEQSRHRWFRTPSRSLWRHCNGKIISPRLAQLFSTASSEG